jgi:hypothetical protein
MDYAEALGVDLLAQHRGAIEEVIAPCHQAILDSYLARRGGQAVVPAEPVMASPQLLDDDAPAAQEPPEPATSPDLPGAEAHAQAPETKPQPVRSLDRLGYGRPPPGGYSVTTGKLT